MKFLAIFGLFFPFITARIILQKRSEFLKPVGTIPKYDHVSGIFIAIFLTSTFVYFGVMVICHGGYDIRRASFENPPTDESPTFWYDK